MKKISNALVAENIINNRKKKGYTQAKLAELKENLTKS